MGWNFCLSFVGCFPAHHEFEAACLLYLTTLLLEWSVAHLLSDTLCQQLSLVLFLILSGSSLHLVKLYLLIFQGFGHGFAIYLQNPPPELEGIWAGMVIVHSGLMEHVMSLRRSLSTWPRVRAWSGRVFVSGLALGTASLCGQFGYFSLFPY